MNVAIVGAGLAGLAAAKTLKEEGHDSCIFEKSKAVGGRVNTWTSGEYVFDMGCSSFAPRGGSLENVMLKELNTTELVGVTKPIFVHNMLRVTSGDPARGTHRYTYKTGCQKLANLLAEGLNIRLNCEVDELEDASSKVKVNGECYDAVIVTSPVPQASLLAMGMGENRPVGNVRYRPCLSVALGFRREFAVEPPYHAIIDPEQRHPLLWLSIENEKCEGRAPAGCTAFVAQMSGAYSQVKFAASDHEIYSAVCDYLERIFGSGWQEPEVKYIKRWRYSQPEAVGSLATANRVPSRLILAGDGLAGARTEFAYESGVWAANQVLKFLQDQ